MQNDNRADFWEILLVDAKNSEADRPLMTFLKSQIATE